jgi:phosphoglycerol transferase MdoB-like AlkP superfamily enzyme
LENLAGDTKGIINIFNTLRYVNDNIGGFMSWLKSHPLSEHTIVSLTGDHNVRGVGYPSPTELALAHAVPLYVYMPASYRAAIAFDPLQIGSHKDIWTTLYNLSLINTEYYNTGCNLFDSTDTSPFCFGFNMEIAIDASGAYAGDTFRPWAEAENPNSLLLGEPEPRENPYAIYPKMLEWQFNRQVQ